MFILEIRPGEGGDDASLFASQLFDALTSFARQSGRVKLTPSTQRIFEAVLDASATSALERFTGTHRIQRIPKNDPRSRRHTSTATVSIVSQTSAKVSLDLSQCQIDFFRGTGPGGQHRNKTSTAVRLRHLPTGIVVTRTSGRSQSANLESAKAQLLDALATRAQTQLSKELNDHRRTQVVSERSAKTFTHNAQRNLSVDHLSGQRWRMSDFFAAKI